MVESKMNRRQFFKTLAATAAGVAAVGVVPRVVGAKAEPLRVLTYKGVPFVYQPDLGSCGQWDSYYAGHEDLDDPVFLAKLSKATEELEFIPPIRR